MAVKSRTRQLYEELKKIKKVMVVGIDPGTGASSPTGFTATDYFNRQIITAMDIQLDKSKPPLRESIVHISDAVQFLIKNLKQDYPEHKLVICIEDFVIQGMANTILQRLVGGILSKLDLKDEVVFINTKRVKKWMTKDGNADKKKVAHHVKEWFDKSDDKTKEIVTSAIERDKFDLTDSMAIAITGYEAYTGRIA